MTDADRPADDRPWFLYILRCRDGAFCTGITTDVERRLAQHNGGRGCAFTARRRPVTLVYTEQHPDKSAARRREMHMKPLSRKNKMRLIAEGTHGFPSAPPRAAGRPSA
jgi:predicted GIY-YIG superfamily endonuclease